jgi:hypothetical protein
MKIEVTGRNETWANGEVTSARVNYQVRNDDRNFNANGFVQLTAEEYQGNESPDKLHYIAVKDVIEKAQKLIDSAE